MLQMINIYLSIIYTKTKKRMKYYNINQILKYIQDQNNKKKQNKHSWIFINKVNFNQLKKQVLKNSYNNMKNYR